MKKNIAMRVASLVLMCTIVTSCFVSSTFAKYTSSATGSDIATVAKWDIKVAGETVPYSGDISFNLFDHIYDTNNSTDYAAWIQETNVSGGKKIAPGTQGYFNLSVKNDSEVTADYTITLAVTNDQNIPIEFSSNLQEWYSTTDNNGMNELFGQLSGQLDVGSNAENKVVFWRWPIGDSQITNKDDNTDTTLGLNGSASLTVTAKITATQVD